MPTMSHVNSVAWLRNYTCMSTDYTMLPDYTSQLCCLVLHNYANNIANNVAMVTPVNNVARLHISMMLPGYVITHCPITHVN